jgi:signal transduction histidine kinase
MPVEKLPCPINTDTNNNLDVSNNVFDDGESARVMERIEAESAESDLLVRSITHQGKKIYVCKRYRLNDGTIVDIYDDITKEKRQEKYLRVLQRIFRHNLRNDLNIIRGRAECIIEGGDTTDIDPVEQAKDIRRISDGLINLAEESSIIRDLIDRESESREVALLPMIESAIQKHQQTHSDVDISVDIRDSDTDPNTHTEYKIWGSPYIRYMINSLISNAIIHNEGDIQVCIGVEHIDNHHTDSCDDELVRVTVSDNGPGIPQIEKEVVVGDSNINPLEHGSGLGLWIVRWIADKHGAEISFSRNKPGTTVEVLLQTPPEDA